MSENENPLQSLFHQATELPTALVHEAWIKLQGRDQARYNDPKHFYAAAASAMRQILIDRARKHALAKHGGQFAHKHLETSTSPRPQKTPPS